MANAGKQVCHVTTSVCSSLHEHHPLKEFYSATQNTICVEVAAMITTAGKISLDPAEQADEIGLPFLISEINHRVPHADRLLHGSRLHY